MLYTKINLGFRQKIDFIYSITSLETFPLIYLSEHYRLNSLISTIELYSLFSPFIGFRCAYYHTDLSEYVSFFWIFSLA